jgi:23S rRNA (cytidine2498-2'-O)-methyltransferase
MASLGLRVTAVDNGRLAPAVLATELVEHLPADGFVWRPRGRVDWLLCDMVAPPARIAALVADWVARGQARNAIFNLKLPTKKRLAEVARCLGLIEARLAGAQLDWVLRVKHLYHDREEVTAFLAATPAERARPAAAGIGRGRRKRL